MDAKAAVDLAGSWSKVPSTRTVRGSTFDAVPNHANAADSNRIDALFAAGITTGCGTDPLRFCANRAVTRAQMASFLIRALNAREKS